MEKLTYIYNKYITNIHLIFVLFSLLYYLYRSYTIPMKVEMYHILQGIFIIFSLLGCLRRKKLLCKIVSYERIFIYIGTFIFPLYPLISALFTVEGMAILKVYGVVYYLLNYLSEESQDMIFIVILIFSVLLNYFLMILLIFLELKYLKSLNITLRTKM